QRHPRALRAAAPEAQGRHVGDSQLGRSRRRDGEREDGADRLHHDISLARCDRLRHGLRNLALEAMRKSLFLIALLLAAAPLLAADGWQADWERTKAAAEKEGEVAYYTLGDDHNYVKEF